MNTEIMLTDKTHPADVLGNLPEEQRERILDWCAEHSFREVLALIARPAPEGLGLAVHYTSLRRFYHRHYPTRLLQERLENAPGYTQLATEVAKAETPPFWTLLKESLERTAFLACEQGQAERPQLRHILRATVRMEDQRLAWANRRTADTAKRQRHQELETLRTEKDAEIEQLRSEYETTLSRIRREHAFAFHRLQQTHDAVVAQYKKLEREACQSVHAAQPTTHPPG